MPHTVGDTQYAHRLAVAQDEDGGAPGLLQDGGRRRGIGRRGLGDVPQEANGGAHRDHPAVHGGGHSGTRCRVELRDRGQAQPPLLGRLHDSARQGVFAGVLRRGGQGQQRVAGQPGPGQGVDAGDARGALGERAGLVQRHRVGLAEALHHDRGLDEDTVAARVGHGGEQGRHGRQHHGAGRGHDHERHGTQQAAGHVVAEGQGDEEDGQGGHDHAERVALLDLLDEQLGRSLGTGRLLGHGHDPGDDRLRSVPLDGDPERARAVQRPGEHLVPRLLRGGQGFTGDGGLVDLARAVEDPSVGADALARPDPDDIADREIPGGDALLGSVRGQAGGGRRGQVEKAADRVLGARGGQRLQRAGRREDHDQQGPVHDLADGGRAERGHDHQQIHVQDLLPELPQPRQGRFPASGDVDEGVQRAPGPARRSGEVQREGEQEERQGRRRPAGLGERQDPGATSGRRTSAGGGEARGGRDDGSGHGWTTPHGQRRRRRAHRTGIPEQVFMCHP